MRRNLQGCVCGNGDEVYRDASLANLPDTRHIIVFFSEKRKLNSHRHLVSCMRWQWFPFTCGSRVEKCLQVMITLDSPSFELEADSCFLVMWPQHVYSIDWMKVRLSFCSFVPNYARTVTRFKWAFQLHIGGAIEFPFPGEAPDLAIVKANPGRLSHKFRPEADPPTNSHCLDGFPIYNGKLGGSYPSSPGLPMTICWTIIIMDTYRVHRFEKPNLYWGSENSPIHMLSLLSAKNWLFFSVKTLSSFHASKTY